MRRAYLGIGSSAPAPGGRYNHYGPLADMSGIDTSAPAVSVEMTAWSREPAWLESAWLCGPWLGIAQYAGLYEGEGWLEAAWLQEPAVLVVVDPIGREYGALPIGASVETKLGVESSITPATVLVNSHPTAVAAAGLAVAAGKIQMSIEEWPNG